MTLELQIAQSDECRAVAEMKFDGPGYKERFQVKMRKAITAARKRLADN